MYLIFSKGKTWASSSLSNMIISAQLEKSSGVNPILKSIVGKKVDAAIRDLSFSEKRISKEIDLMGDPNDPSNKLTYLNIISKMIDNVKPVKINFGSIYEENMNARRYFMLTKQILKYIDENQSIRFLIAECDYPLTVMTALYFSKLFGVDEKIDISPLFETDKKSELLFTSFVIFILNSTFQNYLQIQCHY